MSSTNGPASAVTGFPSSPTAPQEQAPLSQAAPNDPTAPNEQASPSPAAPDGKSAPNGQAPAAGHAPGRGGSGVGFRLENADLLQFINLVASELKLNYVIDPAIRGAVNISTAGNSRPRTSCPSWKPF